jgi:chondroitin AC lyase
MGSNRRRVLLVSAALAVPAVRAAGAVSESLAAARGFADVLARARADFQAEGGAGDAQRFAASLGADGSWNDVDYADRGIGNWRAMDHLTRLRRIARALVEPGHALHASAAGRDALNRGLRAWLQRKPVSDNWWHNTIGQQRELARVLLMAGPLLDSETAARVIGMLQDPSMVPAAQATGQNLIWYASQQLLRGALRQDAGDLRRATDALSSTLRVTLDEGIQADFSFHQHGPQLYSGGYGLGFLTDQSRTAGWVAGTPWAFPPDRMLLLAEYALQGVVPLIRGAWLDWGARGREFTREETQPRPQLVVPALRQLADLVPHRRTALLNAAAAMDAGRPGWQGNRLYWRSDFMVQQSRAGYLSLKMVSGRTVGTESGNGENLLGYWLPFGVTYILRRGDEYDGLPPVWDWSALPGLTAPAETPAFTGFQRHDQRFVGGVSDGEAGLAAMLVDKLQTNARKAWFVQGDMMVALGAGITSQHGQPVRTTLNQTRWRGPVVTDRGPVQPDGKSVSLDGHRWVWMDGVTYLLLQVPGVLVQLERRVQHSSQINPALGRGKAEAEVFMLSAAHGLRPRDAGYAYGVWLGAEQVAGAAQAPMLKVLSNTAQLQAVRHANGLVQAVFHGAGSIQLDERDSLSADGACLVQARKTANRWQIDAAEPSRQRRSLRLAVLADGRERMSTVLQLPTSSAEAGQVRWMASR